ncbi:hypothetical protein [Sporofaciens musculi]|nr:hypothetical protein [Sporofaciens musculi]
MKIHKVGVELSYDNPCAMSGMGIFVCRKRDEKYMAMESTGL